MECQYLVPGTKYIMLSIVQAATVNANRGLQLQNRCITGLPHVVLHAHCLICASILPLALSQL